MKRKSYTDISELKRYFSQLAELSKKEVEYGFYDNMHYSGMTMAKLAVMHEQGWNKLPERNFIFSTALHFQAGLARHIKRMHNGIIQGRGFLSYLPRIGKDAADSIRYTISQGSFSNPKVSRDWASVKGFDDAMIHFGDLSAAATFKVVKYQGK